ncbi:MAG TPA: peptide ABC transporter substrate-binding protein, partial [Candidatus Hydrogenedentes bacterium]|nr:peptide ABC transporter substrate-binding protein [Candidatus Hydrogenedentota bacterium]
MLKVNVGTEVQNLDPHLVSGVPEQRVLNALFEGLADLDPQTLQPIPAVAESWTISEDKLVYTFTLRRNARWSNGDPFTANDFVYSWKRMLSPGLAAEYAYLLYCLKNGKLFNEGKITDFAQVGVKALDDYTLQVTLEHPTPYFLAMQVHEAWFPVHQATIERFGKMDDRDTQWTRAGNFVGNGPFKLAEWWPNEVIRTVRSDSYWNKESVPLDGIEFYPIDNLQTEERSFRAGELHIT